MTNQPAPLTENDIEYVRAWANCCGIGELFTFKGWKNFHKHDSEAPSATTIGRQVVKALEASPTDPRLDFMTLAEGPGKGGEIDEETGEHHRYYKKIK